MIYESDLFLLALQILYYFVSYNRHYVLSIKDFRSQGSWKSSDANVRIFFVQNLRISRNLRCVRTDRGGQFFTILCRRLLLSWTAPYANMIFG